MHEDDGSRARHGEAYAGASRLSGSPGVALWKYLLSFFCGAAIIAVSAGYQIGREYRSTERYWEARLSTLANDHLLLVTKYLDGRREDTQLLAALPTVRSWLSLIAEHSQPAVPPSHRPFTDVLASFNSVYRYPGAYILDSLGNILAQSPGAPPLDADAVSICRRAALGGSLEVALPEAGATPPRLTFAAPIFAERKVGSPPRVVGVAAIADDPSARLFPTLTAEAVPTETGETLLTHREGNSIYYISPLRHPPGRAPGIYRVPFRPDLASVAAVEGREGWGELLDYRGARVLVATRQLPVAGWGLVSKIDRDEALIGFYHTDRLEGTAAGLLILALGGVLLGFRRHQQTRLLEERIARQQDVLNERRYAQDIVDSIPAWLLVLGPDLQILAANQTFLDHFQLRHEEVDGRPLQDIVRTEALPHRASEAVHGRLTSQEVMLDVLVRGREEKRPARVTLADLRRHEGKPRLLLVVEDLTENERLRLTAQASEQRLSEAVKILDAIVWDARSRCGQTTIAYRDPVERRQDLIGTHDLEGTILSANLAVTRRAGYNEPQHLVGRNVKDFLTADVRNLFDEYLARLRREGRARGRMKVATPEGERIIEYDNTLWTESLEKPIVRCLGHDVTEGVRARAELRVSEQRFPLPTFSWRRSGDDFVLVEFNNAAVPFTQGETGRLVGSRATEVYHDRPEIVGDLSRCFLERTSIRRVMPYRLRSTGETMLVDVTYSFVPPDLVMVHAQEVAQSPPASEQVVPAGPSLLGTRLPAVLYLRRNDTRYTTLYVTESVERLTGYAQEDFMQDRVSFVDLYHPSDVAAIEREAQRATRERRPFHASYRLRHKSGEWRTVEEVGVAVREGNEVAYWEGILTDGAVEKSSDVEPESAGAPKQPGAVAGTAKRGGGETVG